jgi:hypothetical protein
MYTSHILVFLISLILSALATAALVLWPIYLSLGLLLGFVAVEARLYVSDARTEAANKSSFGS